MFPLYKYVFLSSSKDIIYNLTMEEFLFKTQFNHPILYLYQNSKTVVIGKHQNPWKECNLNYMRNNNITLCRRTSGGGAVYQDMGNLCFSFIDNYIPKLDFKTSNSNTLITAFNQLGLKTFFNGRNDILTSNSNKKISGSAFKLDYGDNVNKPRYIHHGTLLFDVDLSMMANSLHPHKLKLISNSINSIKSRVINIKSIISSLTINRIKESIISEFIKINCLNNASPMSLRYDLPNESSSIKNKELIDRYQYYQTWKWKYGETPLFTHTLIHKFPFGLIDLSFKVSYGIIEQINIYSDSNDTMFIDILRNKLSKILNSREGIAYNANGLDSIFTSLLQSIGSNQLYFNHISKMKSIYNKMI